MSKTPPTHYIMNDDSHHVLVQKLMLLLEQDCKEQILGEEISKSRFEDSNYDEFKARLRVETDLLAKMLREERFDSESSRFGYELEGWLIDQDGLPAPRNFEFLHELNHSNYDLELSKFNFEFNSRVFDRNPKLLSQINSELKAEWNRCLSVAESMGLRPLWIGTLPTARENMFTADTMSPQNRYYALSQRVLELRKGDPLQLKIDRHDDLLVNQSSILLEAVATSLQIHTQIESDQAAKIYNAAMMITAPTVGMCANSPYLFGKKLWDETRIPVFEQTLCISPRGEKEKSQFEEPVTFGLNYVDRDIIETFERNIDQFPILLPLLFEDEPSNFRHLKLQNGTVWRWNRPIVGKNEDGTPHIRVEHRAIPAGPSIPDMVANIAFYLGLLYYYSNDSFEGEHILGFDDAKSNFYAAAKWGCKAELVWLNGSKGNLQELVHNELLPNAKKGLGFLGIDSDDIDLYLGEIMKKRARTGWSGAAWQKSFAEIYNKDFQAMVQEYYENLAGGKPVTEWKI